MSRCTFSVFTLGFGLLAASCLAPAAFAQSHDQILESCRESVGRPIVQECMVGKRGDPVAREECRSHASPHVRACVLQREQKIAAGKAAPDAPKNQPSGPAVDISGVKAIFVAPPRTIADITAILDQEKPDADKIAKAKAAADAEPGKGLSAHDLAIFYYDRANARAQLSRNADALEDAKKALEIGKSALEYRETARINQIIGTQYRSVGDLKHALEVFDMVSKADVQGARGTMINASRNAARTLIALGDVSQADAYARRVAALVSEARGSPNPKWRQSYPIYGNGWEADGYDMQAAVFEARGQYPQAETAYKKSEAFRRAMLNDLSKWTFAPPASQVTNAADFVLLGAARVETRQGKLSEAEADARRALLETLRNIGKYHVDTPRYIEGLAYILIEQGRYEEAEKLSRASLDIFRTLGTDEGSLTYVSALSQIGNILILQGKDKEASAVYAQIENAISKWEPQRREQFLLTGSRITALYAAGQIDKGIEAAQALVKKQIARVGDKHFETAVARGTLAVGYARSGRDAEAIQEFKTAIPVLLQSTRENSDDDDTTAVAARSQRLQTVVEAYINVLARAGGESVAAETFSLADAVRGRSVQQALSASSARLVATDPALAELVRNEQDLGKQINGQLGALNNILAMPPEQRDANNVQAINATIAKFREDRLKARQEINRRFPAYADLIGPRPPKIDEIKAALHPDEAFISFYFGRDSSFVWAVPKEGTAGFAVVPMTAVELEAKVRKLREALEPDASTISEIPAFDLALGYELYSKLLKPVESGWKQAKSLVIVTNGALGLLPMALLPTAPADVDPKAAPLFAAYRNVPWLARTHAVTVVPSAAALRTLRALPAGKPSRAPLVAFGDPYFSVKEADEAEGKVQVASADDSAVATRGVPLRRRSIPHLRGVNSAELGLLPRLPDTADELRSIADALRADPEKALFLGKAATNRNVSTLPLSDYKVIAFATHGLVPGDLNGLTQPALALSSPEVAPADDDGLLTMEKILALKLDADWVVLSACNSGAGATAGAEAASGLGRAFFYAGTRALLVTNWSVHSQSARELVTDLFRRQSDNPKLSRAEALRQAATALIDGKGYMDDKGNTVFSYAHPLFWAPYTIIGDGG